MGNALIRVLFWQACMLGGVVQADDPKIERLALDNGLTVLLRPVAGTQQVATVLLYSIGSDHDLPGRCGMGHLMEHVYVTAATGDTPAREVRQYTQLYPGGWNAQTGNRYTVVATVTAHKDLNRELADVAARMGDLKITAEDLQREIPRLVQEVGNMFGGIPSLAVGNLARERLRPTPHGGRRGGLPDQVRQVTAEQLQKRWTRYYKPANAILVVVGGFQPDDAKKLVHKHLAKLTTGEKMPTPAEPGKPHFGRADPVKVKSIQPGAMPQACLAFVPPAPDGERYPGHLIAMTRMWMQSMQAGGRQQAAVQLMFAPLDDPHTLYLFAPMTPGQTAEQAFDNLQAYIDGAVAAPVSAADKNTVRNQLAMFLGTATLPDLSLRHNLYGLAFGIGRRRQLGIDSDRLRQAIDALTEGQFRETVRTVFDKTKSAGVIVQIVDGG